MSMISELVEELIDNADLYTKELHDLMYRAADTIEMLSEKARESKQGEWIPCSERLPEEEGNYLVTFTCSFTDCDNFKNFGFGEKCIECKRKQSEAKYKTEPQTEKGESDEQSCVWGVPIP